MLKAEMSKMMKVEFFHRKANHIILLFCKAVTIFPWDMRDNAHWYEAVS